MRKPKREKRAGQEDRLPALPLTTTTLLEGLRNADSQSVWQEFCERYYPVLQRFTRRLGLLEHDAEDATQDALLRFAQAYRRGQYDRERGRLRSWLFRIATSSVRDLQRRRRNREANLEAPIEQSCEDEQLREVWEEEWRQVTLTRCLEHLRQESEPRSMEIFDLIALQGWTAAQIAERMGTSTNAILIVKSRMLKRLRAWQEALDPEC